MIARVVLAAAAAAFLLLPWPTPWSFPGLLAVLGGLAASQSLRDPGSAAPLAVLGLGTVEWLIVVDQPGLLRSAAFGLAGLVVHQTAALGAAAPGRSGIHGSVLRLWAGRGGFAWVAGTAAVAVTIPLAGQPNSAGLVVLGLLAAGLLLALPAFATRRART